MNSTNKNKSKVIIAVSLILIKALYIYINVLMLPDYWVSFSFDRKVSLENISYEILPFLTCLGIFLHYYKEGHPLSFAGLALFILFVIPNNSCMVLSGYDLNYYIIISIYSILIILLLGIATKEKKSYSDHFHDMGTLWDGSKLSKVFRFVTICTCFVTVIYVYLVAGGLNFSGIFKEDMYDVRAQLADFYMRNTDGFVAYFMLIWTGFYSIILLVGLYASLMSNRVVDICFCLFAYFALFTLSMEKGIMLQPLIAIFVSFLMKTKKIKYSCELFGIAVVLLLVACLIEYSINEESVIYTVFIRRILYMPEYLVHVYYDYFNAHSKIWFTRDFFQLEKIVRMFTDAPYSSGIVDVISLQVYKGGIPSPNTGLFGEAFAQMGVWGCLCFPFIVVWAIRLMYNNAIVYTQGAAIVVLAQFVLNLISLPLLASRTVVSILVFILFTITIKHFISSKNKSNNKLTKINVL